MRAELQALADAGCPEITVDEPSMSCYAYREDPNRFVRISMTRSNRSSAKSAEHASLFRELPGARRRPSTYAPMFPAFLDFHVDEMHLEMASREFAELECIEAVSQKMSVAVGVIDVKSYYIEAPEILTSRIRRCLQICG